MVRVILYTGNGEVGKTTIAPAVDRHSVKAGRISLIPSTDSTVFTADNSAIASGNTYKFVAHSRVS